MNVWIKNVDKVLYRAHMVVFPGEHGLGREPGNYHDNPQKAWEVLHDAAKKAASVKDIPSTLKIILDLLVKKSSMKAPLTNKDTKWKVVGKLVEKAYAQLPWEE